MIDSEDVNINEIMLSLGIEVLEIGGERVYRVDRLWHGIDRSEEWMKVFYNDENSFYGKGKQITYPLDVDYEYIGRISEQWLLPYGFERPILYSDYLVYNHYWIRCANRQEMFDRARQIRARRRGQNG